MARIPAKKKPADEPAPRGQDRKKAVAEAAARAPARDKPVTRTAKVDSLATAPKREPVDPPKGRLFAVTRSHGPSWTANEPPERQSDWSDHARFMDDLAVAGFVVAGGPLEATPYIFLAVRADSAAEVSARLAGDPWEQNRMLETTRIVGWELRLGVGKL